MPTDIDTNFEVEGQTVVLPPADETVEDDEQLPPPLWKQALGAVAGATVALALYSVYDVAAPVVTAWVASDEAQAEEQVQEQPSHGVSTTMRHKRGE